MSMVAATTRSAGQIAKSQGIGCRVGTLIGAGWMAYGLASLPNAVRVPLAVAGLAIVGWLLWRSRLLITAGQHLPEPTAAEKADHRRVWRWFWLNLVAEIVLLNVAINLLIAPPLRPYWIPAISLVVGLHFLPMAKFFGAPAYWVCGGAMMAVAALTAMGVAASTIAPPVLVASEAVVNAGILWGTVAWGLRTGAALVLRESSRGLADELG